MVALFGQMPVYEIPSFLQLPKAPSLIVLYLVQPQTGPILPHRTIVLLLYYTVL